MVGMLLSCYDCCRIDILLTEIYKNIIMESKITLQEKKSIIDKTYNRIYDKHLGNSVLVHEYREIVMMGSINYLGLSTHDKVKNACINSIEEHGAGGTGARYSDGYTSSHQSLENKIKAFFEKEHCAVFNSGYLANLGTISAMGKDALIFSDKENHPSIYDALLLSKAKYHRFQHNSPEHFEELLKKNKQHPNKWLVLVGTFGSKGENIRLKEFVCIAKKYDVKVYLDDAHAIAIEGKYKRGLSEKEDVYNDIDILMGSFQMTFANIGAFITGNDEFIQNLTYTSRSYVYTYNLPMSNVAAIEAALDIINSQEGTLLVRNLQDNVQYLKNGIADLGLKPISNDSQVICFSVDANYLHFISDQFYENGVWIQKYLLGENGFASIRLTPIATHTKEQLDKTLSVLNKFRDFIKQ